jgi:hypothetical protein
MNCSDLDCGIRGASAQFTQSMVGESILQDSFLELFRFLQNRTLLVTIRQVHYPITEDILHQIFSPYGLLEKTETTHTIFEVQALVRFKFFSDAITAIRRLQGRNIYDDCCNLEIHIKEEEINELMGDQVNIIPASLSCEKSETFSSEINNKTRNLAPVKDDKLQINLFPEDEIAADPRVNKSEVKVKEHEVQALVSQPIQSEVGDDAYATKFARDQHFQMVPGCIKEVTSFFLANEQSRISENDTFVLVKNKDVEKSASYLAAHMVFDRMLEWKTFDLFHLAKVNTQQGDFKITCDGISTKIFVHVDGFETRIGALMVVKIFIVLFDPGGITKQEIQGNMFDVDAIKCGVVVGYVREKLEELNNASKVLDEMPTLNDGLFLTRKWWFFFPFPWLVNKPLFGYLYQVIYQQGY